MNEMIKKKKMKLFRWICLTACLMFWGCAAVGPDYTPQAPAAPEKWLNEPNAASASGSESMQTLIQWWTVFNDPVLTDLVEQAVQTNTDVRKARARVLEARARRGKSASEQYPVLDASGSATYSGARQPSGSEIYSGARQSSGGWRHDESYMLGFDAGWELDLFGGVRRSIEAAQADLESNQEALNDAWVSLAGEVALNYVEARTLQSRLRSAETGLRIQQELYDLAVVRYRAGLASDLDVQQGRAYLEDVRSGIPSLRSDIEAAANRLAVLLGAYPGAVREKLAEPQSIPIGPREIVLKAPAEVLRNRPDVRGAERTLAAETARVGVAEARLYPRFSLFGSLGLDTPNLSTSANRYYSLGPQFSWNVFDAGAIRRDIEVQDAVRMQALIEYESVMLAALEEVENALKAFAEEQARLQALEAAADASEQSLALARNRYSAGLIDYRDVLDIRSSLLSYQDQTAISRGEVASNLIRLYKALGGGCPASAPQ